jgi:hypothetical protein
MGAVLDKERVVREEDLSSYLTAENARNTYIIKPTDDSYVLQKFADKTYLKIPSNDEYLLKSSANNLYQPRSNYVSLEDFNTYKTTVDGLYQPKGSYQIDGDYLTKSTTDGLYQPKGDYLTKSTTDGLYQPKIVGNLIIPGRVGIGTNNPATRLHTYGTPNTVNALFDDGTSSLSILTNSRFGTSTPAWVTLDPNGSGASSQGIGVWDNFSVNGQLAVGYPTTNAPTNGMIVSGRVGIGTSNPNNILQVGNGGRLRIANNDSDYTLIGTSDSDGSSNPRLVLSGVTRGHNNGGMEYIGVNAGNHVFYTTSPGAANPTEKMRMTTDGRVGIGTSNPTTPLEVNGNITAGQTLLGTWGAGGGNFSYFGNKNVTNTNQYGIIQLNNGDTYISGNNFVKIGPNNNQALTVDNSGNLCIGTTCINSAQLATMKSKLGV